MGEEEVGGSGGNISGGTPSRTIPNFGMVIYLGFLQTLIDIDNLLKFIPKL
jgi:hypothetical protein